MMYVGIGAIAVFLLLLVVNSAVLTYRGIKSVWFGLNPVVFGLLYGGIISAVMYIFFGGKLFGAVLPRWLIQFGHYAVGVLFYYVLIFTVAAVILFIAKIIRLIRTPRPYSVYFVTYLLCMISIIGICGFGIYNAKTIDHVKYSVNIDDAKLVGAEDFKIALISDLHIGYIMDGERILEIADEINKMAPDIVCISGDVFDGDIKAISNPDAVKNAFRTIKAPIYACFGNHDAGEDYGEMLKFLEDAGIVLLRDEYKVIDDRLILVGRRDSSPIGAHGEKREEKPELPADNKLPVVVLDHQPANVSEYGKYADLVLCGHTHNGQMFPINFIVNAMFDNSYGYYPSTDNSPEVVVSSGIGTWGPNIRVASNSELVEIVFK